MTADELRERERDDEHRTHVLDLAGRPFPVTLRVVDGAAQPSEPNNPAYMRGWNTAGRNRERNAR